MHSGTVSAGCLKRDSLGSTSGGSEGRWERTCQAGLELQKGLAGVQRHAQHAGAARSNCSARRSARSVPVCSAHHVCWEPQRSGLLRATLKHRWSWLRPAPTLHPVTGRPFSSPPSRIPGSYAIQSQVCCLTHIGCVVCVNCQVVQGPAAASAGASRGARARAAMAAAGKLERDALFKKLRGKLENKVCSPSARASRARRACASPARAAQSTQPAAAGLAGGAARPAPGLVGLPQAAGQYRLLAWLLLLACLAGPWHTRRHRVSSEPSCRKCHHRPLGPRSALTARRRILPGRPCRTACTFA